MHDPAATDYITYLETKIDFYKSCGIDEVCLVSSTGGNIFLSMYKKRYYANNIPLYFNEDKSFIDELRAVRNKDRDTTFLASYWNFQLLLNNGSIEHFSESSTTNPVKDAVMSNPGYVKNKGQMFLNNSLELTIWKPSLLVFGFNLFGSDLIKLIYYKNLWPNDTLDKYLLDLQTTTTL